MLIFLNLLINTKQFHEITALPNIFFGSLDYPHAPAPLTDLEDEKLWEEGRIGVNKLEHLTWKQGLDLFSCTECGRCHDVCPTYVTDKPLTLKWFNQSLLKHLRNEERTLFMTGKTADEKTLLEISFIRIHSGHVQPAELAKRLVLFPLNMSLELSQCAKTKP